MNFFLSNASKDNNFFLRQPDLNPVWFLLRREPLYHKLQYSKTPKYDPMAAFLGAALGAFVVYLSLSSFGTNGVDLSDLTILLWYFSLVLLFLKFFLKINTFSFFIGINSFLIFFYIFIFLIFLILNLISYGFFIYFIQKK